MGNGFTPPVGAAPPLVEIDGGGDGKVTAEELAAFYRGARRRNRPDRRGSVAREYRVDGRPGQSLDLDGNGKVNEEEWKGAPVTLKKLDANDDELIGAGELVPKLVYPGAAGTILLTPPAGPSASGHARGAAAPPPSRGPRG